MIIGCPNCRTRFYVADAALGGTAGRRVRCAGCGHLWHHRAEPPPILAAMAPGNPMAATVTPAHGRPAEAHDLRLLSASEILASEGLGVESAAPPPARLADAAAAPRRAPAPDLRAERLDAPQDAPGGRGPARPRRAPARPRRRLIAAAAGAGIALVVGVVLVGAVARDAIMAAWPATAGLYAMIEPADPPGAGLEVTLTPMRAGDALVVDGAIVNGAAGARRVPRLKLTLRDNTSAALVSREIDPPVAALPPGATAHFNAVFAHPSIAATDVAVSFAND